MREGTTPNHNPLPNLGTQGYPPRLGYQEVLFHLTTIKKLKQW